MAIEVQHQPERSRYELTVDGERAGSLDYAMLGKTMALSYTSINSRHERHGLGTELVRHVLDDARARGLSIMPICGFVSAYIAKNPDYADLVPTAQRGRFRFDNA